MIPSFCFVTHVTFLHFLDDVGVAYTHKGFDRNHQIQFLCDRQELAYTPKGKPLRVSMIEMSFIHICGSIYWVIDKAGWKPTRATQFCCAGIFRSPQTTSNHFNPLQTASNHCNQLLQTSAINYFKPLTMLYKTQLHNGKNTRYDSAPHDKDMNRITNLDLRMLWAL